MMKNLVISLALVCSFSASAMTSDCTTAVNIFTESGNLLNKATEAAKGRSASKLSESRVSTDEFDRWIDESFSPEMAKLINKYSEHQNVSPDNPIYLGNSTIIETNNYIESLRLYLSNHDKKYLQNLKETMSRVGNAYSALKTECKG